MLQRLRIFARFLFRWEYAGWAIALFGGLAFSASLAGEFAIAYALWAPTGIYAVGCWLSSETLARHKATKRHLIYVRNDTRRSGLVLAYRLWLAVPSVLLVALFGGCCIWTRNLQIKKDLFSMNGVLVPGNAPDPITQCGTLPSSALQIIFGEGGKNALVAEGKYARIISKRNNDSTDTEIIGVTRLPNGNIAVRAHIRDRDDKLIMDVDENRFEINRNTILDSLAPPRPDLSTIEIRDEYGDKLRLRLLNRHALLFTGKLYIDDSQYVVADKDGLRFGRRDAPNMGGIRVPCVTLSNPEGAGFVTVQ